MLSLSLSLSLSRCSSYVSKREEKRKRERERRSARARVCVSRARGDTTEQHAIMSSRGKNSRARALFFFLSSTNSSSYFFSAKEERERTNRARVESMSMCSSSSRRGEEEEGGGRSLFASKKKKKNCRVVVCLLFRVWLCALLLRRARLSRTHTPRARKKKGEKQREEKRERDRALFVSLSLHSFIHSFIQNTRFVTKRGQKTRTAHRIMASPEAAAILRELQGKNGNGVRLSLLLLLLLLLLFKGDSLFSLKKIFYLSLLPRQRESARARACVRALFLSQTPRAFASLRASSFSLRVSSVFFCLVRRFSLLASISLEEEERRKRKERVVVSRRGERPRERRVASTLTE